MFACVVFDSYLNLFDDLKHLSVTNMQKNKKSGSGQTLFHTTVYDQGCGSIEWQVGAVR